jgi:hypothetical protein
MENCTLRQIKTFDEIEPLFARASATDHPNAKNFLVDKMQKRWDKYLQFHVLELQNKVVSFAGIYPYSEKTVRVADRLFTFEEYRQTSFSKNVVEAIRPAVDYFIPTHTRWAKANSYNCFYSIGPEKKRRGMERVISLLDPSLGYSVLPGYYATCNPKLPKCWQTIASTVNDIDLPKQLDVEFV